MRKTVAKRLRKRAFELVSAPREDEAVKTNKINVVDSRGHTAHQTYTLVILGVRRVYKNLKWLYTHGIRGQAAEKLAVENAKTWDKAFRVKRSWST